MEGLRGIFSLRRRDRMPNAWVREFCGIKKGMGEKIDESVVCWFDHMKE